ncbi:MAG: class I SAM-dependent methyltransferase [Gammaproteobacteria bacterium]|nr:class I SAM-dependent methyltransferase [Gammaproteobacteria bacterium]
METEQPKTRGLGHHWFIEQLSERSNPCILELGTRRVENNPSSVRREWVPHAAEYIGTDFQAGADVDAVADVHKLSDVFGENRFDALIACSTLEHIRYPWIAVLEICRVLKPGGLIFVQTHHTYPIHGFPDDYWRFTEEGLSTLFSRAAGFEVISTASDIACSIVSERELHLIHEPAYLNVILIAEKIAQTAART